MIYGKFGDPLTIVRSAILEDVKRLADRKPDQQDRDALANGSYVVVRFDDGAERVYHQAFLRADGGIKEIEEAIQSAITTK